MPITTDELEALRDAIGTVLMEKIDGDVLPRIDKLEQVIGEGVVSRVDTLEKLIDGKNSRTLDLRMFGMPVRHSRKLASELDSHFFCERTSSST